MMRDAQKTIGNLIDKQSTAYISSVDEDGPSLILGRNYHILFHHKYLFPKGRPVQRESQGLYLLL